MAKLRHRIFEMYEFRDEAGQSLMSKSAAANATPLDPASVQLSTLKASRESVVTCLQFSTLPEDTPEFGASFRQDLDEVARNLPKGSRVLLDFSHVTSFGTASIAALIKFNKQLQPDGSRIVLCCISADVQPFFFQDLPAAEQLRSRPGNASRRMPVARGHVRRRT